MHSQAVQGYILVTNVNSPVLADFVARREPVVFACRRNPYEPGAFVGIDNVKAGYDAADYLWARGHKELAVIYPTEGSAVTSDRLAGFCARLVELGIPEAMILKAEAPGRSHLDVGYEAARTLSPWPQSLMCVSDQIAYGVYRFAREQGIRIPEDCVVVSIDGSDLNEWLAPWLRSVYVPYQDFGRHIVDLLETILSGGLPTETILPYRL